MFDNSQVFERMGLQRAPDPFDISAAGGVVGVVNIPSDIMFPHVSRSRFEDENDYRTLVAILVEHLAQYWADFLASEGISYSRDTLWGLLRV